MVVAEDDVLRPGPDLRPWHALPAVRVRLEAVPRRVVTRAELPHPVQVHEQLVLESHLQAEGGMSLQVSRSGQADTLSFSKAKGTSVCEDDCTAELPASKAFRHCLPRFS